MVCLVNHKKLLKKLDIGSEGSSMTADREIEIKLKVGAEEHRKLINWLGENAVLEGENTQVDYYFDPPGSSFRSEDKEGCVDAKEFFRVRLSDKGAEICYKHWYRDEATDRSLYADEYEVGIADGDKLIRILKVLGFQQTALIEKERSIWRYQDLEFALDKVKDLGAFVEVEYKGKVIEPERALAKMYEVLAQIGIKNWRRTKRGYCFIQWNPGKNHFE